MPDASRIIRAVWEFRGDDVKQSRASSFTESLANLAVGLGVSWWLTYWILPWGWGLEPSVGQAVEITLMYTVASVVRSYALRRAFNAWGA